MRTERVMTQVGEVDGAETVAIAEGRGPTAFAANVLPASSRGEALATQEFDQTRSGLIGEAQTLGGVENIAGGMIDGSGGFSASATVPAHSRMWHHVTAAHVVRS